MCDLKMMEIDDLPGEMLLEVHQRLPPSALKMAMLVNKLWRAVGEAPTLWEKFTVTVYSKEDIQNLTIKRLHRIEEISINPDNWDAEDWEAFFRAVMGLSRLKKIDGPVGAGDGVKLVEPTLFARSLAKLEDVDVDCCTCTGDHIQALFSQMSISTRVKKLDLSSCHLSHLEPGLFGKVLSRLEDLDLAFSETTKDQMEAFFTEILNNRSLKRLVLLGDFCENMWRHLKPGFFARVLSTVEEVSLISDADGISSDHMEALFAELSVGNQLKRLCLNDIYLNKIQAALFANVLSRLEEVSLTDTSISTDQIQALVTQISLRTQMKKLALVGTDLSQLDPGLFASAMVRLEDVDLGGSLISTDQMMELFTEMSRNSRMKSLNISFIDLSPVDPEVLSKALSLLETVTLLYSDITKGQAVSLFSEMSQNTIMKKMDLSSYEIDLSSVEPEVLASALIRLEEVTLFEIDITHDQAMAFFTEISQNSRLKKLNLDRVDLPSVDTEVLATAVTNVKEVSLDDCDLTTEQVTSIFTRVLEGENELRKLNLGGADWSDVNQEIVRKVEEKLKGQLKYEWNLLTP